MVIVAFQGTPALAATTPPSVGQALEIAPPIVSLRADPGQKITTQISLRDVSPQPLLVTNEVNDFTAAGEDGTPKLLLDATEPVPYSLKSWIAPIPQITLKSREIKPVTVTINVPKNASPGGYYGVIRFSGTAPDIEGSGVALNASLGALILLRVNGNANERLGVASFTVEKNGKAGSFFETAPLSFISRLKNEGNVFEQPAGAVTVKNMFGSTVVTLGINQPPRNVLPASVRRFETKMDDTNIGGKFLFGRYTAELKATYGTANDKSVTATTSFWIIPWKLITGLVVGLVALFFLLRFAIKRYNQAIIKRAGGNSTKRK